MSVFIVINTLVSLLSLSVWHYYRRVLPVLHTKAWLIAVLFLTLSYIFSHSNLSLDNSFLPVVKIISWLGNFWLAFVFYSMLLMIVHGIFRLMFKFSFNSFMPAGKFPFTAPLIAVCAVLILGLISWGSYRAFSPVVRHEVITTAKPIAQDTKIVLISDLHLGHILDENYSRQLVERVNAQNPDLILIAGDVVDEHLQDTINNGSLMQLQNLKAPLGIYGALGNHDYLGGTQTELVSILQSQNINILQNESTLLNNNIKIVGLPDYSIYKDTASIDKLAAGNDKYFNIIIDHQPRKIMEAADAGYDLMVSGHTHTGQMYPLRLITKNMYLLDYGRKEFDNLTAIVSNGYGFWGPPVRIGPPPEIVVIDLQKA